MPGTSFLDNWADYRMLKTQLSIKNYQLIIGYSSSSQQIVIINDQLLMKRCGFCLLISHAKKSRAIPAQAVRLKC
jgi:hypothetical protein